MTWLLGLAVELTWFAVKPPVRDQKTAKQLPETVRPGLAPQSSGRAGHTVPQNTEQSPRRAEEPLKINSLKDFYNIVLDQIEVVHQLWKQRHGPGSPGAAARRPAERKRSSSLILLMRLNSGLCSSVGVSRHPALICYTIKLVSSCLKTSTAACSLDLIFFYLEFVTFCNAATKYSSIVWIFNI